MTLCSVHNQRHPSHWARQCRGHLTREGNAMAQVNQRLWKLPGQRTKRKAWGFSAQINGKQVRRYKAEWTQDDAEDELAKVLLQIEPEKPKEPSITLAQAV